MRAAFTSLSMLILAACNHASGEEAQARGQGGERSYDVGSFERVSLAGPHDVVIKVGGAPSVRAVGDPEVLEQLDIRIDNGELIVGNRNRSGFSWGSQKRKATVYVTAPSLAAAAVAGSGDMKVDRVEGEKFEAAVSGSGDLSLAAVKVGEASFSIAGSGGLQAAGAARTARVSIAGSGGLRSPQFATEDLDVSIAGSGSAALRATGNASVTILGSGSADIAGGAKCRVTKMGSGSARCTA